MYIYLIRYNLNIIGCYESFNEAEIYIKSCYQHNFYEKASIVTCFKNSCYFLKEDTIDNPHIIPVKPNIIHDNQPVFDVIDVLDVPTIHQINTNIFTTPEYIKNNEENIKLQHDINILKVQKKKIEQSKTVYDSDLKIYNMFKQNKEANPTFIIPEIFIKKYNIFEKLDNCNNLNWENFVDEYKHENLYNEHFSVTHHEEMYGKETSKIFNITPDNTPDDIFEIDDDDYLSSTPSSPNTFN